MYSGYFRLGIKVYTARAIILSHQVTRFEIGSSHTEYGVANYQLEIRLDAYGLDRT